MTPSTGSSARSSRRTSKANAASCGLSTTAPAALDQVRLDDTLYVERIAYDAKGQRALIAYGNGVMTRYAHDPRTFRLKRLRSEGYAKPDAVTYQPAGEAMQDFGYELRPGRQHPPDR